MPTFSITNLSGVFSDKIQINIIHSGITDRDIFKIASALCVHQAGALLKIHFLGFIAYTVEHLIRLVCMELRTGIDVHDEDVVWLPFFIHAIFHALRGFTGGCFFIGKIYLRSYLKT